MPKPLLPPTFSDLEPWVAWSLAKETERSHKRQASTQAELRQFYEAMLPRTQAVLTYLNQFSLDALPEEAKRLLYLALSLAEVSPAIELFGKVREDEVLDVARFVPDHE